MRILPTTTVTLIEETAIGVARWDHFLKYSAPTGSVRALPSANRMPEGKRVVYVLKSASPRAHYYIGPTHDVPARLADHNAGRCPHTARYCPWQLHVVIELPNEQRAVAFERYLKSGSGRAFAKRHFG